MRTSGSRASSRGTGRGSRTARHVDGSSRARNPAPAGVSHTAATTTTNSTGYTSLGSFQPHSTDCSTIPSAIAAAAMVGSRSMRPITAAASAGSRSDGPSTVPSESPDDARTEEHGEERQDRRDRPHDRVHAAHRDADQGGAVDVVGAGRASPGRCGYAGTARARRTRAGSRSARPRRCRRSATARP